MERLVGQGVSEVVLVAQDLAAYGRDLADFQRKPDITDLLRFLTQVEGLRSLRLPYLYPKEIRPALIEEMASNPTVASYFDLSLQHATRLLLRAMKRPGGADSYAELIHDIRRHSPGAALRSSFILGFPGETDADVEELGAFLAEVRLDWAGLFPYSAEAGTPAAELEDRVPPEEVGERLRYLQSFQEDITAEANLGQVGRRTAVLIHQIEDRVPVGRSYRQAPEIDGMVLLDGGEPGVWVEAEVTAGIGADMEAKRVGA